MVTWEHEVLRLTEKTQKGLKMSEIWEMQLDRLGSQGWELVTVTNLKVRDVTVKYAFLKRPMPED